MFDTAIRVENLSKKYILSHQEKGHIRYKSLRDVIADKTRAFGKYLWQPENLKIRSDQEEFWALKDVSFEIKQGDRVGIIGRNGAGKSTLLKILSRITEPAKGTIELQGRVASLLEVGTGFHPELTGRENIFLNGAILGMSRTEIQRKYDEIVDFAEVEKFLDTPVKRYSSGMYVRLAFAVAAHLEPEILIVDEVLAVGDGQFQKKCLGKMGEVAKEGRTIIFVSHSMNAIAQLTRRCILLSQGQIQVDGETNQAVQLYLSGQKDRSEQAYYQSSTNKTGNYVVWARVHTSEGSGVHCWGEPIVFEFALNVTDPDESLWFSFQVISALQQPMCIFWFGEPQALFRRKPGVFILRCKIPKFRLYMGLYTVTTWFSKRSTETLLENLRDIGQFEVTMHKFERPDYPWQADECSYLEESIWQDVEQIL
jgi:ABC-type polysaccharide/polyol phosphate transport system ATPase subunit